MAWRPTRFLVEGMLDNTKPNKVTGWMKFAGLKDKVTFDLEGDFHRDIRGAIICFTGDAKAESKEAQEYMKDFAQYQTPNMDLAGQGKPSFKIQERSHLIPSGNMSMSAVSSSSLKSRSEKESSGLYSNRMIRSCGRASYVM